MLALALTLLFVLGAAAALISLIDSGLKAQAAYARLLREAAVMRAGFVVQVAAQDLRMRRPASRISLDRRSPQPRPLRVPACAAA